MLEFWEWLPENERIITDVLRGIVIDQLPKNCEEKLTNNVPYFFGKRRICMIWPASIPGGGIKKGVLFGFSGNRLKDHNHFLDHGKNKRIFYKIYQLPEDIDEAAIIILLKEAVEVDNNFK
ncbi:MAG: hypothetical protein ABI741_16195 [Ferruginibacter sp.]